MTKRGRILRDTNVGPGMLTADGTQYNFTLEHMWISDVPPRVGMPVDVHFNAEGSLESVAAVSDTQIAKEQAQKALAGAMRHGQTVRGGLISRVGVVPLCLVVFALICFFFLPNLVFGMMGAGHALTGWETVGLDVRNGLTNDHGLLSLLAVVCLLAPLATAFLDKPWNRWLLVAPFAFTLVAFITIYSELHGMLEQMGGGMRLLGAHGPEMSDMFRLSWGAYLLVLCAIALAWRGLRTPRFAMPLSPSEQSASPAL